MIQICFLLILIHYSTILIKFYKININIIVLQMIYQSITTKYSLIVFKGNFPRHVMVKNQDKTANVVKDLGFVFSDVLNWMLHIHNKLLSYNKSLHFIKRNFLSPSLNPRSSCLLTCVSRVSFFMHHLFGFLLYVQTENLKVLIETV